MKRLDLLVSVAAAIARMILALMFLYFGWTGKGTERTLLFMVLVLLFMPPPSNQGDRL